MGRLFQRTGRPGTARRIAEKMMENRLSVHKLVEDSGANGKYKTLIAIIILAVIALVQFLVRIPEVQDAVIQFIDPAGTGWITSAVKYAMDLALFSLFIIVLLVYGNMIIKKQHIDEMRIYVTGIGFVDRKKKRGNLCKLFCCQTLARRDTGEFSNRIKCDLHQIDRISLAGFYIS
jgi:hypothetical protein